MSENQNSDSGNGSYGGGSDTSGGSDAGAAARNGGNFGGTGSGDAPSTQATADFNKAYVQAEAYNASTTPSAASLFKVFAGAASGPIGAVGAVIGGASMISASADAYNGLSPQAQAIATGLQGLGSQSDAASYGHSSFGSSLPSRAGASSSAFSLAGNTTPTIKTAPNVTYPASLDFSSQAPTAPQIAVPLATPSALASNTAAAPAAAPDTFGKWASILTVLTLGASLLKGAI